MFIFVAFLFDINDTLYGKQVVWKGSKQAIYSSINVTLLIQGWQFGSSDETSEQRTPC
jgi:hypothetical protein